MTPEIEIVKLESLESPPLLKILSAYKSTYRSKDRFVLDIEMNWNIGEVEGKYRHHQARRNFTYDRGLETLAELRNKVLAYYTELINADTSDADLIFQLERVTIP